MTASPSVRWAMLQNTAQGMVLAALIGLADGLAVAGEPPGLPMTLLLLGIAMAAPRFSPLRRARRRTEDRLREMRVAWSTLDAEWRAQAGREGVSQVQPGLRDRIASLRPRFAQTLADAERLGMA